MGLAATLALAACGEGTERVETADAAAAADAGAPEKDANAEIRHDERPPADGGPGPAVPYRDEACAARLVNVPSELTVEETWRWTWAGGHVTTATQDLQADGTDDQVSTFDAAGRPLESRTSVGPEMPWAVTTWTYDTLGYLTEQVHADDTGFVTERIAWTYDEHGRRARQDNDQWEEGDTEPDVDFRTEWLYDERGHQVEERFDFGADGEVDRRAVWTWDERGRRVAEETYEAGRLVARKTLAHDEDGNVVHEEDDVDGDGRADTATERDFGDGGRLLEERWDFDADGRPDQIYRGTYDDAGLLVAETWSSGDGLSQQRTEWAYAAPGRPLRRETRVTGAAEVEVMQWSYDAEGRTLTQRGTIENGAGEPPSSTWSWSYDCMR
jgi:YD repeat-containing protein